MRIHHSPTWSPARAVLIAYPTRSTVPSAIPRAHHVDGVELGAEQVTSCPVFPNQRPSERSRRCLGAVRDRRRRSRRQPPGPPPAVTPGESASSLEPPLTRSRRGRQRTDRKSTRLNSSHITISYA